jgi:hypothetical protein
MASRIDLPEDLLRRRYVDEGKSSVSIAAECGCHPLTVRARLREYGIPLRPRGWHKLRRHVAEAVMAGWPSPEMAYAVGLVASDGNLPRRNHCVVFTTAERELAGHFVNVLGLTSVHVVTVAPQSPRKGAFIVQICDHVLRSFMEARGLTADKSLTIGPLDIPASVFRDFLRGEMDGDGSWLIAHGWRNVEYLLAKFTSKSPAYLEWLKTETKRLVGIEGNISGHALVYNGRKAEALGDWMYYDSQLPCLTRKRAMWSSWMALKANS